MLDTGLQYEAPLLIRDKTRLNTKIKSLKISQISNNTYQIQRFDRGSRKLNLYLDLNDIWTPEDHTRASSNNFQRDIPLKYGIITNKKKIGLKMTGDQGKIVRRMKQFSETLYEGEIKNCAKYLNINPAICQLAYENFTTFRASQRSMI